MNHNNILERPCKALIQPKLTVIVNVMYIELYVQ